MNTKEAPQAEPPASPISGQKSGVAAQVMTLVRALLASPRRRQVGLLALGVVLVICANAGGQIRLNSWQGAFYDAIEQRHLPEFAIQLLVFAAIAGALLVLVVARPGCRQMIKVRLREWLTYDLLDQWLPPSASTCSASPARSASTLISASTRTRSASTELTTSLASACCSRRCC